MLIKRLIKKISRRVFVPVKGHMRRKYLRGLYGGYRVQYYKHATVMESRSSKYVSIIVPCFNTPDKYLEPLLSSVFAQGHQNWELILVDASSDAQRSAYIEKRSRSDTRIQYIRTTNEGIAANTNKGLDVAGGEYIAFLDHDDMLDPDALAESVVVLDKYPEYGMVYSDEDKVSDDGERYFGPHYKPGFSLDMLRNLNYITHFVVVRKSIVDKLGGIRLGFDGAQDYDFLLRLVDEGVGVAHIPKILYHWREAENSTAADFSNKNNILEAGCKALDEHYKRNGIQGVKNRAITSRPGWYAPEYKLSKGQRAIVFDLTRTAMTQKEKDYIVSKFEALEELKKHDISIETDPQKAQLYDTTMTITAPAVPIKGHGEIVAMFGLAEESGVAAVMPIVSKHGKIADMGIVETSEGPRRLFRDVAVDRNDFFGSLEWVRNVDNIKSAISVRKTIQGHNDKRCVVWAHAEYSIFDIGDRMAGHRSESQLKSFYNQNVAEIVNTTQRITDYIVDELEEKQ